MDGDLFIIQRRTSYSNDKWQDVCFVRSYKTAKEYLSQYRFEYREIYDFRLIKRYPFRVF